jgi:hypothetical protein
MEYKLSLDGEIISTVTIPSAWVPKFGSIFAATHGGKTIPYRAIGIENGYTLILAQV